MLSRQTVDLVLLDVMMPHMNGYQVCRRLRDNPDTARLNVIMITARGSTEEMVSGLDAGADDYLPKPFEVPEFLAQLRLRELQERLVGMERAATIGQMVITLSHEINNPLCLLDDPWEKSNSDRDSGRSCYLDVPDDTATSEPL